MEFSSKFDFLFNAIGISSASRIYFNKNVSDLTLEESAVFVAMLKNPRQYNPHRKISREKSKRRRDQVFKQMERNGLKAKELEITDSAVIGMIRYYTREAGVRGLEREVSKVCRKAVKDIFSNFDYYLHK